MQQADSNGLLRSGLLDGVTVLLARAEEQRTREGAEDAAPGAALRGGCEALGARVIELAVLADGSTQPRREGELEAQIDGALGAGSIDTLLVDAADLYDTAARRETQRAALGACLSASWEVTRASVARAFLARERGGRIVYLAPAPDAGEHAEAARAGLENLARTLSIEWARRQITAVTIAPAPTTRAGEVAALLAYLASPAGAYFSGCLLDLRGAQPDMPPNRPPVT